MDTLRVDIESPKIMGHWEEIMNRINSGDMPPDDVEKRPKPDDISLKPSHCIEIWVGAYTQKLVTERAIKQRRAAKK